MAQRSNYTNKETLACTYASLILYDDDLEIDACNISKLLQAANIKYSRYWPQLFSNMIEENGMDKLITNLYHQQSCLHSFHLKTWKLKYHINDKICSIIGPSKIQKYLLTIKSTHIQSLCIKLAINDTNRKHDFIKSILYMKQHHFGDRTQKEDEEEDEEEECSSSKCGPGLFGDDSDSDSDSESDDDDDDDEGFENGCNNEGVDDGNNNNDHEDNKDDETIGLAVGGAKDVNNFRQLIEKNIMPSIASITYNGLLYEYYFDTKTNRRNIMNDEEKEKLPLFYPSYLYGKAPKIDHNDNSDNKTEMEYDHYLTVGLNSNIKQKDFKRKPLNLMIVLDQSGSMCSRFNSSTDFKSKMQIANESVITLLSHLNKNDRFGFITFDHEVYVKQKLMDMDKINLNELKKTILSTRPCGGTNFEIAYNKTIEVYQELFSSISFNDNDNDNNMVRDNRIIYLTDALINIDETNPESLLNLIKRDTDIIDVNKRIFTTFIGIGLDFNVELIEHITKMKGCNYYSVHSSEDFKHTMDEDFEYMVTPLVFNVSLMLESEGDSCCIEQVYGIKQDKKETMTKTGEIKRIYTLFPSKKVKKKGTKGGIVVVKLKPNKNNKKDLYNVTMKVEYEDRNGKLYKNEQNIILGECENDDDYYFDNIGIRKGILLSRYVSLIKQWIENDAPKNNNNYYYYYQKKLSVSKVYKLKFTKFLEYFLEEMKFCNDNALNKETEILNILINAPEYDDSDDSDDSSDDSSDDDGGLFGGIGHYASSCGCTSDNDLFHPKSNIESLLKQIKQYDNRQYNI